jgi:hypothetical protein
MARSPSSARRASPTVRLLVAGAALSAAALAFGPVTAVASGPPSASQCSSAGVALDPLQRATVFLDEHGYDTTKYAAVLVGLAAASPLQRVTVFLDEHGYDVTKYAAALGGDFAGLAAVSPLQRVTSYLDEHGYDITKYAAALDSVLAVSTLGFCPL